MHIKVSIPEHWGSGTDLSSFLDPDGLLDGHRIFIDKNVGEADAWFVIDEVPATDTFCEVPANRVFFISAEQVFPYDYFLSFEWTSFFSQFSATYSPFPLQHRNARKAPPFLPPMLMSNHGTVFSPKKHNLHDFLGDPIHNKRGVSIIASSKDHTSGHRVRLWFLRRISDYFGERVPWFGNGFMSTPSKAEALTPYRASIAVENRISPDHFTEKLIDPLIAGTIPLYIGAPNILDYFPLDERWILDPRDFPDAVAKIKRLLDDGPEEQEIRALADCRSLALGEYHFLRRMIHIAKDSVPLARKGISLQTRESFSRGGRLPWLARIRAKALGRHCSTAVSAGAPADQ